MRKFKGMIVNLTAAEKEKYNLKNETYLFSINGCWSIGSEKISSYIIVDKEGNEIEEFSQLSFSRSMNGCFYLESVN